LALWEYFLSRSQNSLLPTFSHNRNGIVSFDLLRATLLGSALYQQPALIFGYAPAVMIGVPWDS
jgi:hypothetical protein